MKVAVLGWYGHRNFGDELLLQGIKQLFNGWTVTVYSDNQKSIYPKIDFEAVNKHDLFVLGGGELVNCDRLFIDSPWVNQIKIPKVMLGCGVNAEKPSQIKQHVITELEQFSYIGLRDTTAVNILSQFPQLKSKIGLFYDLAFAVAIEESTWQSKNGTAIVIPTDRRTNRSDKGIREYNLARKTRKWLAQRLNKYEKTLFLPFGQEDNNDFETALQLAKTASYSEVYSPNMLTLQKVTKLIRESTLVIPYRLHGLILSYIIGADYDYYPYHWKLSRVHNTITSQSPCSIRQQQKLQFKTALEDALA